MKSKRDIDNPKVSGYWVVMTKAVLPTARCYVIKNVIFPTVLVVIRLNYLRNNDLFLFLRIQIESKVCDLDLERLYQYF